MRLSAFLVVLLFYSCQSQKVDKKVNDAVSSDKVDMAETNTTSLSDSGKYSMKGLVTYSNSYCGGMRPTDEMLAQITSPKPVPNAVFYIRKGSYNNVNDPVFMKIQTDNDGKLNFKIDAGEYVIIDANRLDSNYVKGIMKQYEKPSSNYTPADKECLDKWLSGYLFHLIVKDEDNDSVSWNTHNGCFYGGPCIQYIGPYPP